MTSESISIESWTCVVCGESEARIGLSELCGGCGEPYHYNHTSGPGKDCGAAWVEDEEIGMIFFCNTCMDTARTEDQQRIETITRAAASGTVSPDMLAELMEVLAKTGGMARGNASPLAAFPGMAPGMAGAPTGLPGVSGGFPGPIPAADLARMLGQVPPAAETEDAPARPSDAPPPLAGRRSRPERRYRRIQ